MSNVRSGKAIKREVFEQTQNTLIYVKGDNVEHFSKLEDKIEIIEEFNENIANPKKMLFVWVGAKRSDIFELDAEDIERLLDNQEK